MCLLWTLLIFINHVFWQWVVSECFLWVCHIYKVCILEGNSGMLNDFLFIIWWRKLWQILENVSIYIKFVSLRKKSNFPPLEAHSGYFLFLLFKVTSWHLTLGIMTILPVIQSTVIIYGFIRYGGMGGSDHGLSFGVTHWSFKVDVWQLYMKCKGKEHKSTARAFIKLFLNQLFVLLLLLIFS